MKKTLFFFVGTHAELMKVFPVINRAKAAGYDCKIISNGQNDITDSPFLKLVDGKIDLNICYTLPKKKKASGYMGWFINTSRSGKKILSEYLKNYDRKTSLMIIHGDTLSTVMGAYLSRKCKMPFVHIESGLRSYNFLSPFPEEFDRLYGSLKSKINFCPGEIHAKYASKRFKGKAVDTVYNTGIETLFYALGENKGASHTQQPNEKYFMFMLHRQENLLNKQFVVNMAAAICRLSKKIRCVFIYHKQTKETMEKFGVFTDLINNPNITSLPLQNYLDFIKLVDKSEFVVTDGCGNQQEFFYLGKPYLIMRKKVEENTEGLGINAKVFSGDFSDVDDFYTKYLDYTKPRIEPKVMPSEIIVKSLDEYFKELE